MRLTDWCLQHSDLRPAVHFGSSSVSSDNEQKGMIFGSCLFLLTVRSGVNPYNCPCENDPEQVQYGYKRSEEEPY